MYLGTNHKNFHCKLGTHWQETTEEKKDMGILNDHRITMSHHGNVAMKKAKAILGHTRLDKIFPIEIFIPLNKCRVVWFQYSPSLEGVRGNNWL